MHGHISTLGWLLKRITLYLSFAVLIETNIVLFCHRVLILKKDENLCHVKKSYSNKTNKRSTGCYLRNVFLKLKRILMLLILF